MNDPTIDVAFIVDPAKIHAYLLNPAHPKGGPKAKYLTSFGFVRSDPAVLAMALVEHALANMPGRRTEPRKGSPRIVFEGRVAAPDGRHMPLRTVWQQSEPPAEMRFITAVPLTK